jgi:hypothetical protein
MRSQLLAVVRNNIGIFFKMANSEERTEVKIHLFIYNLFNFAENEHTIVTLKAY